MALALHTLEQQTRLFRNFLAEHPYASGATALTIFITRYAIKDYNAWWSIEAGGLPHNPLGYVLAKIAETQNSPDLRSTALYTKLMVDSISSKRYIEDIPIRAGAPPVVTEWAVPVRQISAHAEKEHIKLLDDIIHDTVSTYSSQTLRAPSKQEGGRCDALWSYSSSDKGSDAPKTELYHFHHYDGSAHTTLAPADAQYLLDRGWGQRHPLSGVKCFGFWSLIAANFVMVYAPRSEEETNVHKAVAKAAVEYALARRRWEK